jgi:hypothetical protein
MQGFIHVVRRKRVFQSSGLAFSLDFSDAYVLSAVSEADKAINRKLPIFGFLVQMDFVAVALYFIIADAVEAVAFECLLKTRREFPFRDIILCLVPIFAFRKSRAWWAQPQRRRRNSARCQLYRTGYPPQ